MWQVWLTLPRTKVSILIQVTIIQVFWFMWCSSLHSVFNNLWNTFLLIQYLIFSAKNLDIHLSLRPLIEILDCLLNVQVNFDTTIFKVWTNYQGNFLAHVSFFNLSQAWIPCSERGNYRVQYWFLWTFVNVIFLGKNKYLSL
jgi:hypothetical protein